MTPDEFRSALTNGAEFPVDLLRFMAKQRWAVAYEHDIWINGAADRIESLSTKVRFLEGACTGMREENDALAAENAALKEECAALVNGDEYQAMQRTLGEVNARLAEALERAAAAESKEVCTVAHSDEVMEFCPYCKIERLTARLAEAERELSAIYAACRTNPDLADYIYDVFGMAAWIIKPEIGDDAHG
jgi:hypothetical protein